jgi:hypothetical protein
VDRLLEKGEELAAQLETSRKTSRKAWEREMTVISVGVLPELLWLREAVLEAAGHKVRSFTEPERAVPELQKGGCGVLLLCYSVRDESRIQLLRSFREYCPDGRIVAITNFPVLEQDSNGADELVYGVDGPEALLDAIGRTK